MTVRFFSGFETNGIQEWTSTVGTPTVQSSVVYDGTYACVLGDNTTLRYIKDFGGVANDYVFGAYLRVSSLSPSNDVPLMSLTDQPDSVVRVDLTTSGGLSISWVGDGGTPTTVSSPPISANTWHLFELYVDSLDTGGYWNLFIDGTSVASQSSTDTLATDYPDSIGFGGNITHGISIYIDNVYWISNVSNVTERWGQNGDWKLKAYWSTLASATGDYGSALTSGLWSYTQEFPWSDTNSAAYDTSSAISGSVNTDDSGGTPSGGGPNNDADVSGATFLGAGYLLRGYRGGGSPAEHYLHYGTSSQQQISGDLAVGTSAATYGVYLTPGGIYDLPNSWLRIGFGKSSGARGFFVYELYGQVAYTSIISSLPPPSPMKTFMPFLVR